MSRGKKVVEKGVNELWAEGLRLGKKAGAKWATDYATAYARAMLGLGTKFVIDPETCEPKLNPDGTMIRAEL